MIPKNIITCWFGPEKNFKEVEQFCKNSIEKVYDKSRYNFIHINEKTFDVNSNEYTRKAYEEHLYAYVSDYARLWALEKYGGIYFDTDVVVIKEIDNDILNNDFIIGSAVLKDVIEDVKEPLSVGVMASIPHHSLLKKMLKETNRNSQMFDMWFMKKVKEVFYDKGLTIDKLKENKIIKLDDTTVYPFDYFTCTNWHEEAKNVLTITDNTYCVHLYNSSWNELSSNNWKNILLNKFGLKSSKNNTNTTFVKLSRHDRDEEQVLKRIEELKEMEEF